MSALAVAQILIFGGGTAMLVTLAAILVRDKLRDRRKDREWAAGLAAIAWTDGDEEWYRIACAIEGSGTDAR